MINGLSELAQEHGRGLSDFLGSVDMVVHGTTVTTNAVLTGRRRRHRPHHHRGFRDALLMRRACVRASTSTTTNIARRRRSYPGHCASGNRASRRTTARYGAELDPSDALAAAAALRAAKVEALAVCFMHAYANAANEAIAARAVSEALPPELYLSVSLRVLPQVGFYRPR